MKKNIDIVIRWILYIYAAIFPWCTYVKKLYYNSEEKRLISSEISGISDAFVYTKAWITVAAAAILLVLIILQVVIYKQKIFDFSTTNNKIVTVCIGVYIFCTVISTLIAANRKTALWGGTAGCEGVFVLCAYVIIMLLVKYSCHTYRAQYGSTAKSPVEYIVLTEAVILTILTAVELFYKPVAQIIMGSEYENTYGDMISLTFNSPSYCAAFIILLAPFCIHYLLQAGKLLKTLVWSGLSVSVITAVILTRSTAAFYIVLLETALVVIVTAVLHTHGTSEVAKKEAGIKSNTAAKATPAGQGAGMPDNSIKSNTAVKATHVGQAADMPDNRIKNNIAVKALCLTGVIVCVIIVNVISGSRITDSALNSAVNKTIAIHSDNYYMVRGISVDKGAVTIKGSSNALKCIINDEGNIYFTDEYDNILNIRSDGDNITFPYPYDMISAGFENSALWLDLGYKGRISFAIKNGQFYPMAADGSLINDISSGDKAGEELYTDSYKKIDALFTGRGYIWRKTLPLLKNTIIFGHGAGTFGLYFKQFDYAGLLNSQGNVDLIVDRPHSMYIQMAFSQGILCMTAYAVMVITVIITFIKDNKCKNINKLPVIIAVIGFCIMELITDSSITVNPIFWAVLGLIM